MQDRQSPMGDRLEIAEVVQNWALWRDAGHWDRFRTVWAPNGWMSATWFQGPAQDFINISKEGFDKGVSILHFLGGTSVDIHGSRAIASTKMTISQRGTFDGTAVDVVCTGRFYDFVMRHQGDWKLLHRQPIYEKDRIDPVDPAATLKLDMPMLKGDAVQSLYRRGEAWLAGGELQR